MNYINRTFVVVLATMLGIAGCSSSNNDEPVNLPSPGPADATFKVQVLHGSPDAPAVNVFVGGAEVLSDVDYKQGSGALELPIATLGVAVEGIIPGGNATVIGPVNINFEADTIYTIAAVGPVADIEPVVISQPDVPVGGGAARLFVLHAAAGAPTVDVYVTDPDAELAGSAAVGSFSFKETIGPAEVAAGNYRVRVTGAGDIDAVVYDSGEITLNAGDDLTLAAVPNTTGGEAAISLVALNGAGSLEILDENTPTSLQVVHASSNAPDVDVLANGAELVGDLPFGTATGFLEVPADIYTVEVTVANDPDTVAIGPADIDFAAGVRHSVLAIGQLENIEPLILTDDARRVATEAKVRIVHASTLAGNVDIYVTAPDADITDLTPTLADIPFGANTGYLSIAGGTSEEPVEYDVTVVPAGTKDAAIGPATIPLINGGIYTAIARDPLPESMNLGLILSDDFAL